MTTLTPDSLTVRVPAVENELGLFDLFLACGREAHKAWDEMGGCRSDLLCRTVYCPHPLDKGWTGYTLNEMRKVIQHGSTSVLVELKGEELLVTRLWSNRCRN